MGEIKTRKLSTKQGTDFLIRTASVDDAPAVLKLYRSVIAEGRFTMLQMDEFKRTEDAERLAIADDLKQPGNLHVVAEVEGQIVGMARVRSGRLKQTAHFGDVDSVWVNADWRRQGIGDAIIDAIVRWAEANEGLEKLGLFVFSTSEAAIALYQRNGFIIEGRAPRDIKFGEDDYADTIIMGRMVDGSSYSTR
jgi:ribosomal protein S18 acetylase RimI-like enzyme